ncbi:hypothetical protein VOLCADRAFT_107349 [Volvox carteri f. nagariensis]|uniref:DNA polymerase alpha subunit B n=1 Tax=Volvox carteri f. nagariensis TaxID=3068 RepID=D8UDF3_VOLCA|nr:uncharacterized protein VOLCADRAFT_107349 [Volvox carteri f. nagariensis]EFJ42302.1 hypothetical protein VOLCADRAFT_107349 [Volvox carteri f. nagariensis]|eukprot:XP_002956700.1 hypothetical protein VOLCADRAFT_107349 [Volvox carteri f. nagariensis]
MATAAGLNQQAALERAFASKNYSFSDAALTVRAQQLTQQLQITPESFANQYDSFALISDWSMEVTAQRLKVVADYLESEQRKENSRPRGAPSGMGGSAIKAVPQAAKPTWEDLPDKLDYTTPSAKRQALDPASVNPGNATKPSAVGAVMGTPQPSGLQSQQQRRGAGGGAGSIATTPLASRPAAGTPSTQPPSAFSLRTNQGQLVAVLNDNLPGPAAYTQQRGSGVVVRQLGQPPLDTGALLFMMEVLETKVHALDERIMDFADALTAATRHLATASGTVALQPPATGTPRGAAAAINTPLGLAPPPVASAVVGTPSAAAQAAATPGALFTPGGSGAAPPQAAAAAPGVAEPLQHSVADMSHQPVWVAGRVLAETEGAPLNSESLLLEGCREASGGARVRLDVSCLPAYRLFPGQSICAYGLNPTGGKFIAQKLVTHVPPPPPPSSTMVTAGATAGPNGAASREGGLSLVVAAGPYCLSEDLSYSPLEELLSYCNAHPPDVLLLLGPFVDQEHPGLLAADRTAESFLREEVVRRLAVWRAEHPAAMVAIMPAVRDLTAMPVLPQPPMTAVAQAVGPPDKAIALQNPATVSLGPLLVGACSTDLLKALSASEHSRMAPGTTAGGGERLPALASHVLGQRSYYPLYPAPPGTCLDTSHYSQLQLPVAPDVLLLPSDLAPFAKVLTPATWMAGAPPDFMEAVNRTGSTGAAAAVMSTAPVVVINPGRLSRGSAGGTFAHVVVSPGAAPVVERTRVEPQRLLQLPASSADHAPAGLTFAAAFPIKKHVSRGTGFAGRTGSNFFSADGVVDKSTDNDGDADDTRGGAGGDDSTCTQTCFTGLAIGSSATCKAHEFDPGMVYMLTDARTRRAGQSFFGDRTRLRAALKRYRDGGNLTVVTIGGSITAGQGAVDAPSYPKWLQHVLDANLPDKSRVRVHNGAVPGTSSQYMSSCHNVHVPKEADIIFVEYAVNDDEMPMPHMNNQVRRPYEKLLRKLLGYPNRPAVVLLHGFCWFRIPVEMAGQFWNSGERQQSEFGLYYGLPQLSIKACCYHHMVQGKKGFQVKRPRADTNGRIQHENGIDLQLKDMAFYYDVVHPDGHTGHRVMAEVAGQLILDVWADVAAGYEPSAEDLSVLNALLPAPMLPDNLESAADKCFIGPAFQNTMIETDGFEWVNEGKSAHLPKWGYVGDAPDKYIKFKINTQSTGADKNAQVTVELGYLRSYENMGRAAVQCETGCSCTPWILDGHHDPRTSQTFLHAFKATQAEECVISVRIVKETTSGKHKVKITGAMVSEDPDARAFQNWAAFDWVSVASSKDPKGVFEISNTARRALVERHAASSADIMRRYHQALEAGAAAATVGGADNFGVTAGGELSAAEAAELLD